jgi:ribosomal protein L21E
MFARDFRKHGALGLTKYLTVFKRGDIVDIKVRPALCPRGRPALSC